MGEIADHDPGGEQYEIISGGISLLQDATKIVEKSADWSSAWASVADAGSGIPLFGPCKFRQRCQGRTKISNYILLGLQTGRIKDLKLPFET